jgi:pyridoxamine 5'-phosphate oxidase
MPRFLGIDFGWEGKPSGLACLDWDNGSLHLRDLRIGVDLTKVLAWVDEKTQDDVVVGVDAPLVIPNASGMRDADKLAHTFFGKYHAGAYPASQERAYWKRTTGLSNELSARGYDHGAAMLARQTGRFQIEVHPHAATVQFNALDRIVKYKRGTLAQRRAGLERLRSLMLARFPKLIPHFDPEDLPAIPERGTELKALEDQLDAITCAYVAAHWWFWGLEKNQVLGDAQRGYIVVPQRYAAELPLAGLRENYNLGGLRESDVDANPFVQFEKWFGEAKAAGVKEPNAMTLATCGADGQPSARVVLLKGLDESGFVFYTNYESRKGRDLEENPKAALAFFWADLERQVRIQGNVTRVSRAESEAYFNSRPVGSRLGAWASQQSAVVPSRKVLEDRYAELEARYANQPVPLPPFWGGFRLEPDSLEFWQGRPSRLHDRLRYRRAEGGAWIIERLSP